MEMICPFIYFKSSVIVFVRLFRQQNCSLPIFKYYRWKFSYLFLLLCADKRIRIGDDIRRILILNMPSSLPATIVLLSFPTSRQVTRKKSRNISLLKNYERQADRNRFRIALGCRRAKVEYMNWK